MKRVGPGTPTIVNVSPEVAVNVRLGILALEAGLTRPVALPGLGPVDEPEFGHDQTYGPMTAWVVTNARAMLGLANLDMFAAHMELAAHAEPPEVTAMALRLTAGRVGRQDALAATQVLASRVSATVQKRRAWRDEVESRAADLGMSRRAAREYLASHLDVFVKQVLAACAIEDVLPRPLRLQALGAWRCLASPTEDDPGAEWRCSASTAAFLREFFSGMDEAALVDALNMMLVPGQPDQEAFRHRLIGSTLIRAASPPPLAEIVGPGLLDVLDYRGGRSLIDQLARLLVALCEPPTWASRDDIERTREVIASAGHIAWPDA